MAYRLLLDENVEHEVQHRLDRFGHDVEHVEFVDDLGKGETDATLAAYSVRTNRTIVTYDEDFIENTTPGEYRGTIMTPRGRDFGVIVAHPSRFSDTG